MSVNAVALFAAELGYKACEKGHNLQATLIEIRKILGEETTSKADDLIFVSMPYSDPSPEVIEARMAIYCREMGKFALKGERVIGVLWFHYALQQVPGLGKDWKFWKEYSEALIRRCKKVRVLMAHNWEESEGVIEETKFAKSLGITVEWVLV